MNHPNCTCLDLLYCRHRCVGLRYNCSLGQLSESSKKYLCLCSLSGGGQYPWFGNDATWWLQNSSQVTGRLNVSARTFLSVYAEIRRNSGCLSTKDFGTNVWVSPSSPLGFDVRNSSLPAIESTIASWLGHISIIMWPHSSLQGSRLPYGQDFLHISLFFWATVCLMPA